MSTTPTLNEADLRFLAEALGALDAAAELSNVAAVRGTDLDVRALARWTLAAQHRLIAAVRERLDQHTPSPSEPVHPAARRRLHAEPATAHLRSLEGPPLDSAFLELLGAHIHRSLVRARAEMVDGVDADARDIAQRAIRKHSHELEAIDRLAPLVTGAASTSVPPTIVTEATTSWENEGGHLASAHTAAGGPAPRDGVRQEQPS